jgi:hypothetical protein
MKTKHKLFLILFAAGFCFSSVLAYAEYKGGKDVQAPPKPFNVVLEEAEEDYKKAQQEYDEANDEGKKSLRKDLDEKKALHDKLREEWERFLQDMERPIADTAPEGESDPEPEEPPKEKENTGPRWWNDPSAPYEGVPEDFMASLRGIKPEVQIETGSLAGDVSQAKDSQTCTV